MVVCAAFVPVMFIAGQTRLLFRELAAAKTNSRSTASLVRLLGGRHFSRTRS
jgi:multidrug efflux pump subunit AcrB